MDIKDRIVNILENISEEKLFDLERESRNIVRPDFLNHIFELVELCKDLKVANNMPENWEKIHVLEEASKKNNRN